MKKYRSILYKVVGVLLVLLCFMQQLSIAQCGTISTIKPTASAFSICGGASIDIRLDGLPVQRWIYRNNFTGPWFVINTSGNLMNEWVASSTNTVKTFRAIVVTANCTDTTAGVDININQPSFGINNQINISSSASAACAGTSVTLRLMNEGIMVTSWLYRTTASSAWEIWNSGTGHSATIQLPSVSVPTTWQFRTLSRSQSCRIDSSAIIDVQILPATPGSNASILPITNETEMCALGMLNVQVDWEHEIGDWLYRDGSGVWQIADRGNKNLSHYVNQTSTVINREYRVILNNPYTCTSDTSASTFVTIKPVIGNLTTAILPRFIGSAREVCAGTSMSFSLPGFDNISTWQFRDSVNGIWFNFGGNNNNVFLPGINETGKRVNRSVRVILNNTVSNCSVDTSQFITYTIKPNTRGKNDNVVPFTATNELSIGAPAEIRLPMGNAVLGWIFRDNEAESWQVVNTGTNIFTNTIEESATNVLRTYHALIQNPINCSTDTTEAVQVLFKTLSPGSTISVLPIVHQQKYCAGNSITGQLPQSGNNVLRPLHWIYRDNDSAWWEVVSGSMNGMLNDTNTNNIPAPLNRYYRAVVRNMERISIDTTLQVQVTIQPTFYGNTSIRPFISGNSVCRDTYLTVQVVQPVGYVIKSWLKRDTTTEPWSAFMTTNPDRITSDFVNTNFQTRMYRALIQQSSACVTDTTDILTVSVQQKLGRTNNAYKPNINLGVVCAGKTGVALTLNLTTGVTVIRWQRRDNLGLWQDVSGQSAAPSYIESAANSRVLELTIRDYRAILRDNNNCSIDTTDFATVRLEPWMNGQTTEVNPTTNNPTICAGTSAFFNISLLGNVQRWMYRDDKGPWQDVPGNSQSLSYTQPALLSVTENNTTREYRVIYERPGTCFIDTSNSLSIQILPASYGNAPTIQPVSSVQQVCAAIPFFVQIPSSSNYTVHKWISRDNPNGSWLEIPTPSASFGFTDYRVQVVQNTYRQLRAIVQTHSCSYDTSNAIQVLIKSRTPGNANAVLVSTNAPSYCVGENISASVVNNTLPPNTSIKHWLYRDQTNGKWTQVVGSSSNFMSQNNVQVSQLTTRFFRVVLNNNNNCSADSSAMMSVTLKPNGLGFATGITPTISTGSVCDASVYPVLFANVPSGYNMLYWMMNDNGTGWKKFPYNASNVMATDYHVNMSTPVNRTYRVMVSNSYNCTIDSSLTTGISITPRLYGNNTGIIPMVSNNGHVFCYGKPINISVQSAGYNVLKWIYEENNSGKWNDFSFSTSTAMLTDAQTLVAQTTSRAYKAIIYNPSTCRQDTSAAVSVIIHPRSARIGNSNIQPTTASPFLCSGSSANLSIETQPSIEIMSWIYSDNGMSGPWNQVMNSFNNKNITHQQTHVNSLTNRLYRAIITDTSTCDLDTSASTSVIIRAIGYGTDFSIQVTGADSICVGSNLSLDVNPGSGNIVYDWLTKSDSTKWQPFSSSRISNSVLNSKQTPLTAGVRQTYTPIIYKSATCSYDTVLASKTVVFKAKNYGNSFTGVTAHDDTICVGSSVTLSVNANVERWLYRDGKFGNWNIIPNGSQVIVHQETLVPSSIWRYYRAIIVSGSCMSDTTLADSVFIKHTTWGNTLSQPIASPTNACEGVAINLVSPVNQSRWLYRDGVSGNWNTLVNEPIKIVNDYQTLVKATTVRYYRYIAMNPCSFDTSEAVSVTINPKTRGKDNNRTPTASTMNVCSGNPVQNLSVNTSGVFILQWIYRDNNGVWKVHSIGNQNNISDYNTFVQQTTTRHYAAIINNNVSCRIDTTNAIAVNIKPIVRGNSNRTPIIQGTGCMGNTFNVSMSVGADTTITGIIYSTNGGAWESIGHVNPFSTVNVSQFGYHKNNNYNLMYRALLFKTSSCSFDTTSASTIVVNTRTNGNDNSIVPTGPSSACANSNIHLNVNAGTGNSVRDWIFKEGNGPWTRIYVATDAFIHQVNTSTTIVRQYRALIAKGNNCSIDTSASISVTINPVVYGFDNTVSISVESPKNFCTGNSFTVSTTPSNAQVQTWLYRDNFGRWNNLFQNANTITEYNTNTTTFVQRSYAAVIWKPSACALDTTILTDNATITNRSYGSDTSITISSLFSSICAGTGVNLIASNLNSHSVHGWLYRNNSGLWSSLSTLQTSSVNDFNTNITSLIQRDYAVLVRKSNMCRIDTGVIKSIFIYPRNRGTDQSIVPITNNDSICSGSTVFVNVNPGSANSIIKWIVRTNNAQFADFALTSSNAIQDMNTQTGSVITRQYRAIIAKANSCLFDTSAGVTVAIIPNVFGSQSNIRPIVSEDTICSGSFNSISISGYTGSGIRNWLQRNNGGSWISTQQSAPIFIDNQTTVSAFTYREYRALINNTSQCRIDTSGAASFGIHPFSYGNITAATQALKTNICSGSPAQLFVNPVSGYELQRWLINDGAGWQTVSNSQALTLNHGNTLVSNTKTKQFRALLRSQSSCAIDSTVSAIIQLNPFTNGINLSIQPHTTTPILCSGKNAIIILPNQQIIQWLFRDSISDFWKMIPANGTLLSHQTNVPSEITRQYRAIVFNPNNCSYDSTASIQVQVKPQLISNAKSVVPVGSKQAICSGSTIQVTATGFVNGGVVVNWLYSDGNGPWIAINAAGSVLNHSATIVQSQIVRRYRALVNTGCQTDTTDAVSIVIDTEPAKPFILATGNTLTCSEVAASYQWKRNGVNISGATSKTYQATLSGDYTVEIANNTGCVNISDTFPFTFQSVREVQTALKASIYPNPNNHGIFYVELDGIKYGTAQYAIVSITGKTIQQGVIDYTAKKHMLDLSNEHSGVYFVTITYGDKTMTKRLVYAK